MPCSDHVLHSSSQSHKAIQNWALTSSASSSSLLSVLSQDTDAAAKESLSPPPSHHDVSELEDEIDDYTHSLRRVRTCSLRRMLQKTFLEPICDDCLLVELGVAPEAGPVQDRRESREVENAPLTGAEWLLESNVEITVESPTDDAPLFPPQSNPSSSSDDSETEDKIPRRGRGRRRALELNRESMPRDGISASNSPSGFRTLRHIGHRLRRARKHADLNSRLSTASHSNASSIKSSTTRPLSWIAHLKTDLSDRSHRTRPDLMCDVAASSNHRPDSSLPSSASSSSTTAEAPGEQRENPPSPPSHLPPATLSSASYHYNHPSPPPTGPEQPILVPLDQLISSSDFDSSPLGGDQSHPYPQSGQQQQQRLDGPDRDARGAAPAPARASTSFSSGSAGSVYSGYSEMLSVGALRHQAAYTGCGGDHDGGAGGDGAVAWI